MIGLTLIEIAPMRRSAYSNTLCRCRLGWCTGAAVQRRTVHKHRNLLAHAPERMHEEIGADYTGMSNLRGHAGRDSNTTQGIRKWRLKHRAAADSSEERGDRLFSSPLRSCRRASGEAPERPMR